MSTFIGDYCCPYPEMMGFHETRCKHGTASCLLCGTSDARDVVHKTEGGRGSVSKLFESGKKRNR